MSTTFEPNDVSRYKEKDYWNERFEKEPEYDWLGKYENFKYYCTLPDGRLKEKKDVAVLVVGCGNSTLSFDMFADGFTNLISCDYSDVVIEKMKQKYAETAPEMKWVVADVTNMQNFADESFDLVVDKGVMDALMVDQKSYFKANPEIVYQVHKMCLEVKRILKPGGRFVYVSFHYPHFRRFYLVPPLNPEQRYLSKELFHSSEMYERRFAGENLFGWKYEVYTLPDVGLGYFVFLLDKPIQY